MSKAVYRCPACQNEVDRVAVVCSNPACRKDLAFCSRCRDITTFTVVEKSENRFARDQLRCDRCQGAGVKCLTWAAGGYCNGLARAGGVMSAPICVICRERFGGVGKGVAVWGLMAVIGKLIKPRK